MENNWSVKQVQDIILDREQREKKNLYATDSERCLVGVWHQMKGDKATKPDDPRGLRRMEVGGIVESNQVKKLRSLGIFLGSQFRIYDEEFNVSGRPDAILVSPLAATPKTKHLIDQKAKIYSSIRGLESQKWELISKKETEEMGHDEYLTKMMALEANMSILYTVDKAMSDDILADKDNKFRVLEIKSIVKTGFDWRAKEGKPMDSHLKQTMFYLWKLRQEMDIDARILYVDTSYQDLLEFDVPYDEAVIEEMKQIWKLVNDSVANDTPPPLPPAVVLNPMSKRWQVNYKAEWCQYHDLCTGDANWLTKAKLEVEEKNQANGKSRKSASAKEGSSGDKPKPAGDKPATRRRVEAVHSVPSSGE